MGRFIANRFESFAEWISDNLGNPYAFIIALSTVILWAATGPVFGFSDTWQLVINTSTTIITFLMVFLLQNTGNRTIDEMHDRLKGLERQNQELIDELRKMSSK
jgi:low affinity Fe/Cu permease